MNVKTAVVGFMVGIVDVVTLSVTPLKAAGAVANVGAVYKNLFVEW